MERTIAGKVAGGVHDGGNADHHMPQWGGAVLHSEKEQEEARERSSSKSRKERVRNEQWGSC